MNGLKSNQNLYADFIWAVWKRKWLVLGFGILVIAATHVMTKRQTKVYEAVAQIVIDLNAPQYLPRGGTEVVSLGLGAGWNTREFLETQYRIIRSRWVGGIVVERLGLDKDEDFLGLTNIEDAQHRQRRRQQIDAVRVLLARLVVEPSMERRVVRLKVTDHDPKRAMLIANELARAYADQNVNRKVSAATEAVLWLKQQTLNLKNEVKAAEDALLVYKRENNILNSTLEAKQNVIGLDLQDARKQHRSVVAQTASMKAKLDSVKSMSSEELQSGVEEVIDNGLFKVERKNRKARSEAKQLLKRYLPKHPDVLANEQNMNAQKLLRAEVQGIRTALQRQYSARH